MTFLRKLKGLFACALFGAVYGAACGALYGAMLAGPRLAGAGGFFGAFLGGAGGCVFGVAGGIIGGPLGWGLAGALGGYAAVAVLAGPTAIFGNPWEPLTSGAGFATAYLLVPPALGATLGVAVGRGLRKGTSPLPGVNALAKVMNAPLSALTSRSADRPPDVVPATAPQGRGDEASPAGD
jgi:hypothetical protein